MLVQATEQNQYKTFLINGSSIDLIHKAFPPSAYQVREISLTPEEDEALSDLGDQVCGGHISHLNAIWAVCRHNLRSQPSRKPYKLKPETEQRYARSHPCRFTTR